MADLILRIKYTYGEHVKYGDHVAYGGYTPQEVIPIAESSKRGSGKGISDSIEISEEILIKFNGSFIYLKKL